jgi:hypothetical protein
MASSVESVKSVATGQNRVVFIYRLTIITRMKIMSGTGLRKVISKSLNASETARILRGISTALCTRPETMLVFIQTIRLKEGLKLIGRLKEKNKSGLIEECMVIDFMTHFYARSSIFSFK